jgi:cobalt-zinc-cadmium efflux system protein
LHDRFATFIIKGEFKMSEHEHNGHTHHHDISSVNKGRLLFVIAFNFIIALAEVVGGILSGSLSLISDAIHNLSDTASIILSYASIKISEKPKNKTKTYGYKRANILSAFINSASLIGIAVFLVVEAIKRFANPTPIVGNIVIIVAIIGLLGNLFSVLLLKKGANENINIKSSYLHLISDALSSVAVIASGIVIKYAGLYWVDPILTIFINIVIIKSSYSILKESINILMQSTPVDIDIDDINSKLQSIAEVKGTHHIHVWRLDENNIVFEGHVQIDDMLISKSLTVSDNIQHLLEEHFKINHAIIQFESANCQDGVCKI